MAAAAPRHARSGPVDARFAGAGGAASGTAQPARGRRAMRQTSAFTRRLYDQLPEVLMKAVRPRPTPARFDPIGPAADRLRVRILALLLTVLAFAAWASPAAAAMNASDGRYAALVVDAVSGEVLTEVNADQPRYPASLTKLMTLYMTFQAVQAQRLTLQQTIAVSANAASQPPTKLGLPAGDRIAVEDAILALVTESANDIAVVLAEAIGGSESRFAQQMTEQARWLGMNNTVFYNASGLPNSAQHTTARDMARLAQALQRDFPQYYHYFSTRSFTYRGRTHRNHNGLLSRYQGMDGLKTGYIRASGFNLVASAQRGNLRVIGVVFGGTSVAARDQRMAELLDAAFVGQRGQFLMAHGSSPFQPPVPGRRPNEAYAITVASELAPSAPTTVLVPAGASTMSPQPALPTLTVLSTDPADDFAPLPPLMPVGVRADTQVASIAPVDATGPIIGGDLAAEEIWSIQVGAYNDPETSRRILDRITASLPQLMLTVSEVLEVRTDTGMLYRARFTGLDYAGALNACKALMIEGTDCLPIAPPRDQNG